MSDRDTVQTGVVADIGSVSRLKGTECCIRRIESVKPMLCGFDIWLVAALLVVLFALDSSVERRSSMDALSVARSMAMCAAVRACCFAMTGSTLSGANKALRCLVTDEEDFARRRRVLTSLEVRESMSEVEILGSEMLVADKILAKAALGIQRA